MMDPWKLLIISMLHCKAWQQCRVSSFLFEPWSQKQDYNFYNLSVFLLMLTWKIASLNINTCASNSEILCKDACSMQARRLHSSSSKPVIWYLNSAISWARSSASSFALNFSSLNSSWQVATVSVHLAPN